MNMTSGDREYYIKEYAAFIEIAKRTRIEIAHDVHVQLGRLRNGTFEGNAFDADTILQKAIDAYNEVQSTKWIDVQSARLKK